MLNDLVDQLSKYVRVHTPFISDDGLDQMLSDISKVLLGADVQVQLVATLRQNVKKECTGEKIERKKIMGVISQQLVQLLSGSQSSWHPKQKRPNIVVFLGLQGAGKTTTIMKYAYYYKNKGFKVGLVACDTYRAGAKDQLSQNARKIKVPFFTMDTDDAPEIAKEGCHVFRQRGFDLILVDTAGRHKQEASLFSEMADILSSCDPHHTIFVMDSTIGQQAYHQAKAFQDAVTVGSIILTKMDGARGGGALSAVAATNAPVVFVGTGEHYHQFESFDANQFVSRIMGHHLIDEHTQKISKRIAQGQFCLRDLFDQIKMLQSLSLIHI